MVLHALKLCSGYDGMGLGLRLAGVACRTVAHVERDAHAASVLVARMEDKTLDPAPIWDDLTTFDSRAWRGRVDLVTAGFPCQPFSAAGQRRGVDDPRWLWPHIARIIRDVEPSIVFLENVPLLVKHGLPYVLDDLAAFGFDAEWGLLSAAAVGAPHKRQRFWLLAVAHDHLDRLQAIRRQPEHDEHTRGDVDGSGDTDVAHPDSVRHQGPAATEPGRRPATRGGDTAVADTEGLHEREPHHVERPQPRSDTRGDLGGRSRWPPCPDDTDGWDRWRAAGGPEPSIRRGVDGSARPLGRPAGNSDQLHLLGNGAVPACVAHAWRQLTHRLTENP